MDKKRLQKLCLVVFVVSVIAIVSTSIVDWIGNIVVDMAFSELGEDEFGIVTVLKSETVKMVRAALTGGRLSLFSTYDKMMGGSSITDFIGIFDGGLTAIVKEAVDEATNPIEKVVLYFWAYMPMIRDVALISCAVSILIWYLIGGKIEDIKSLWGQRMRTKVHIPPVKPGDKGETGNEPGGGMGGVVKNICLVVVAFIIAVPLFDVARTIAKGPGPLPTFIPASTPTPYYTPEPTASRNVIYDIGIPNLRGREYDMNTMNLDVYWVQVQLKATGLYYQGDNWDETGNLGDHTMSEIARFMRSCGYRSHRGQIDQAVIDELANYLGCNVVPVYAGGFYEHMNSIMVGGSTGSMNSIVSNLRDGVPRVTLGARWVQSCLKKLGYYHGSVDGKYGSGTENAVKAFQKDYGFVQRDYVSLGVARAMIEACYYAGYALNDLP